MRLALALEMNKDGTMWDDFEFHLADVQGVTDGLQTLSVT